MSGKNRFFGLLLIFKVCLTAGIIVWKLIACHFLTQEADSTPEKKKRRVAGVKKIQVGSVLHYNPRVLFALTIPKEGYFTCTIPNLLECVHCPCNLKAGSAPLDLDCPVIGFSSL
jgi:hypothetical protein